MRCKSVATAIAVTVGMPAERNKVLHSLGSVKDDDLRAFFCVEGSLSARPKGGFFFLSPGRLSDEFGERCEK